MVLDRTATAMGPFGLYCTSILDMEDTAAAISAEVAAAAAVAAAVV